MSDTNGDHATIFDQLRTVLPAEHHGLLTTVIERMAELHGENIRFRQNMVREIQIGQHHEERAVELNRKIGQLQARAGFYKTDARLMREENNRLRRFIEHGDRRMGVTDE